MRVMLRPIRFALVLSLVLGVAGCAEDDPEAEGDVEENLPEEEEQTAADNCDLPAALESPTLSGREALYGNQPHSMGAAQLYHLYTDVDGTETGMLRVELWDDRGVFTGGIGTTGTYVIEGDETDADTCGVCVYLMGEHLSDGSIATLLASSGTVVIDNLDGTMVGSVSDLSFRSVGIYNRDFGECSVSLNGTASFEAPIYIVPGGGGGGGGGGGDGSGTGGGDGSGSGDGTGGGTGGN